MRHCVVWLSVFYEIPCMNDNLIFPIGFDLEAGFKAAEKNADVVLRRLETALNRRPLSVPVTMDASKFAMFERQFSNSINGIQAKLTQAQRLWNSMTFDVKFDENGNLSRRAQIVFDAFNQLTQASATMGQRLGEVNRQLAQSEAETARLITVEYDKRKRQIDQQIRDKERQAAAEERVRQSQLKGINVGYVDLQKQTEVVRNLRLQYEAILPMLNAMAQKRVDIKVRIDKQFEADINRINAEIARLRQSNLQLEAKGDTNAIQANLAAIRQLEAKLQRISQQKIDLLNTNKINSDISRLRTEIASMFGELQSAERKLASDNSLNAALDVQSQKVLNLHAQIQKLDQQIAQLNAQGKMYNADGSFTSQATALLQQRIALTKQLEQASVTGQQAQIKLEQQLREEKRRTDQEAKQAAKEAERQAKAEAAARKQAIEAANAENKARQAAYNARRKQGLETQRILQKEAKSIADITVQLQIQQQRLNTANVGSAKFNKIAGEVKRLTAELDKANQKMRELTGQTTSGAARQASAVKQVSKEFRHQSSYLQRLTQRMVAYWSIRQVGSFLTKIREVTAQFELQRVSLGAILQDQNKANQLFSQIKGFALKSPVSILDLTKYTKQLAAYKIGYDELFETTKKLTDVSVGLGVSMDRVILAYGQVRATGHLRASEIRQFTEMGVPIVEELAAKLSKMNGELVTAADVMKLVEERGISFELVKEVFDDMTSAGGIFYNMQEKQGNTLYGLWMKLGDAASVMYEQIGNTGPVNAGMKKAIKMLTELMRNWEAAGFSIATVTTLLGAAYAAHLVLARGAQVLAAAQAKVAVAAQAAAKAQAEFDAATKAGDAAAISAAQANVALANSHLQIAQAALANTQATKKAALGLKSFKGAAASFASMAVIGLVIAMVSSLVYDIKKAYDEAHALQKELNRLGTETSTRLVEQKEKFERLADAVVNASEGTKAQTDALEELHRTFGDVIPVQDMTIERLRQMRNGATDAASAYRDFTQAIEDNIRQQMRQQAETAIQNHYNAQINAAMQGLRERLEDNDVSAYKQTLFTTGLTARMSSPAYRNRLAQEGADQGTIIKQEIVEALREAGIDGGNALADELMNGNWFDKTVRFLNHYNPLMPYGQLKVHFGDENADGWDSMLMGAAWLNYLADTHKYGLDASKGLVGLAESLTALSDADSEFAGGEFHDNLVRLREDLQSASAVFGNSGNTFADSQMLRNQHIQKAAASLATAFGSSWDEAWVDVRENVSDDLTNLSRIDFAAIAASDVSPALKQYAQQVSQMITAGIDSGWQLGIARHYREYVGSMGVEFQNATMRFLPTIDEQQSAYRERLEGALETAQNSIRATQSNIANNLLNDGERQAAEAQIQTLSSRIRLLQDILSLLPSEPERRNGRTTDERLRVLAETASSLRDMYKQYQRLSQVKGATQAYEEVRRMYADAINEAQAFANANNMALGTLQVPRDSASLVDMLRRIAVAMGPINNSSRERISLLETIGSIEAENQRRTYDLKLRQLAEQIKAAKEYKSLYDELLAATGDENFAQRMAQSVFGATEDADTLIRQQLETLVGRVGQSLDEWVFDDNGKIDYSMLARYADQYREVLKDAWSEVNRIATEGQASQSKALLGYVKDLAKAKTYAQKRVELARTTANAIAAIEASSYPDDYKRQLKEDYRRKETRDAAALEWDAFRDMPIYVQMFSDLDSVATSTLENMRSRIEAMQSQWNQHDPTQLREMQSRLAEIDAQLAQRNPFKTLANAIKEYRELQGEHGSERDISEAVNAATAEYDAAREALERQMRENPNDTEEVEAAKQRVNAKEMELEALQKIQERYARIKEVLGFSIEEVFKVGGWMSDLASGIASVTEAFGGDEEDVQYWNDIASGLSDVTSAVGDLTQAAIKGDIGGIISSAVTMIPKLLVGFSTLFSAGKIQRADKEIKKQQELLEQLEYTYSRLNTVAEELFGTEYIDNYNSRLRTLQAQQTAYLKQAEAERSKGKKADKEKIKEYENSARDTMNEIADMQGALAEKMLGTDVASAAEDFATAWLQARLAFGDSTEAITAKFKDMIKNMVVNSAMARMVQSALNPFFDKIDAMYAAGATTEDVLSYAMGRLPELTDDITNGLEAWYQAMMERGIDLQSALSDKPEGGTGIVKNVSSATSEEINANTAALNVQNYYSSHLPIISQNVASILAAVESRIAANGSQPTDGNGWSDWQQQAMDHYYAIARNTADTVTECRRIATACLAVSKTLNQALRSKGSVTGFNAFIN